MAFEKLTLTDSLLSSGGSTGDLYKIVVATSSNQSGGYAVVAVRGAQWTGILQGNSTEQVAQTIGYTGISRVAAGASSGMDTAITEGSIVISSTVGQVVPATSAGVAFPVGYALETLTTGSTGVIAVLLTPGARTTS